MLSHRLRGTARGFLSPSGEGPECERGSEMFGAQQGCRIFFEASVPSRIPSNCARSHGRCCRECSPHSKSGGYAHSYSVQFWPDVIGDAGHFTKVERPQRSRSSHSAWGPMHGAVAFLSLARHSLHEAMYPSTVLKLSSACSTRGKVRRGSWRDVKTSGLQSDVLIGGDFKEGEGFHRQGRPCRRGAAPCN